MTTPVAGVSARASTDTFRVVRKSIECVCGGKHNFSDLEKIIVQHYQEPYGCTGGAYWYDGEWNYVCPSLNKRVRILFFGKRDLGIDYQQAKELEKSFKRLYGDVWKSERRVEHTDGGWLGRDFFNNTAIDDDPIGYGLVRKLSVTETRLEIA